MSTKDKTQALKAFATKLSAFRASLSKDEQALLDAMAANTAVDVEAHGFKAYAVAASAKADVAAHSAAVASKAATSAAVRGPARFRFVAKGAVYEISGEPDEDVSAHARGSGKGAVYEISGEPDEDVSARARRR